MNFSKLILLLLSLNVGILKGFSQTNPTIQVLPGNSGVVALNSVLNLEITIGNTGTATVVANKLRPIITVPAIVTFLPDADQLPGLPPGWSIVSNTGSQLRICNGSDLIAGQSSRTIILKVRGVIIGGPSTFQGQINYGGATCAVVGPAPNGNNNTDDISSSTIQVVAGCSLGVTATAGTILCNGGTTTITATATNATGALEYSIVRNGIQSPFQSNNVFPNEIAGSYSIIAREAANPSTCVANSNVLNIVDPPAVASPVVAIVQPTCSSANGQLSITSPTVGLSFSIDGSAVFQTYTGPITIASGAHSIVAKNNNNCLSAVTNFTVDPQPVSPQAPAIGTVTQPDCVVSNGSIQLTNLPTGNWTINPGNITGNTNTTTVSNLPAGTYTFIVTNQFNCNSAASAAVNIIAVIGAPATPVLTLVQPTCTVGTGSATISSSTAGLEFSLDGSAFSSYPVVGYTSIAPGVHTIIARNVSGCLSPLSTFVIDQQPTSPAAATVNVTQPTCTTSNGKIEITSTTIGLTFSLDAGPFTTYPALGYVVAAGIHTIAVQNSNGCTPTITNNIVVNPQPATPTVSVSNTTITCFGSSSTITCAGNTGVAPYQFSLNGGPYQTSNTFTVPAGTYIISIRDANGCIGNSNSISITQPNQITGTITAGTINCNAGSTTITVTATGGFGAYEYSLNGGTYQPNNNFTVFAGTYSATIRLVSNISCNTSTNNFTVTQPALFKSAASFLAINECGGKTNVNITAVGGTMPYTNIGVFSKGPGTHNFLVTDSKGCTSSSEVTILPPGCVDIEVFPNPAKNNITINHSKAETGASLQIFTMNGALVFSKAVQQGSFISNIDIVRLASATYILRFINGKDSKEVKFVKTP